MKNKFLPLSLLASLVGLAFVFTSFTIQDGGLKDDVRDGQRGIKAATSYLAKLRNNQTSRQLPIADVLKSRNQIMSNLKSGMNDLAWSEMGPGLVGGKTRSAIFDQRDESSNTIIAGSVSGGLWKTSNYGVTWSQIGGANATLNVTSIVQANNDNIFVATGEAFTVEEYTTFGELNYNGAFVGRGIYKSIDGESFEVLESTVPVEMADDVDWAFINKLSHNGNLYAATNTGLRYSLDDGETWALAKYLLDGVATELVGNALDIKTSDDGILITYVENQCYVSTNNDPLAFVCQSAGDSLDLPDASGRMEFAIAPSNSDIIYAVVIDDDGDLDGVYYSATKGNFWKSILPGGTSTTNVIHNGDGLYSCSIEVFPTNENKLIVAGRVLWVGELYDEDNVLFEWNQRSSNFGGFGAYVFPSYLPTFQHSIQFRPGYENEFIVASDRGVSTAIAAATVIEFSLVNRGYNTSLFLTANPGPRKDEVIGGSQGLGAFYISGLGNSPDIGINLIGSIGSHSHISFINPNVFIYGAAGGNIYRTEDQSANIQASYAIDNSSNNFMTPTIFRENFNDLNSPYAIKFTAHQGYSAGSTIYAKSNCFEYPIEYVISDSLSQGDTLLIQDKIQTRFFIGTNDAVYMTPDMLYFSQDPNFYLIADADHSGLVGKVQSMALSGDGNTLFVGTMEGGLYKISNLKLAYFEEMASVESPYCIVSTEKIPVYDANNNEITQVITSIAFDQNNNDNVLITLGNYGNDDYVYYSTNARDDYPEFTSIQSNLPLMPVYASLIEMDIENNTALIGTETGVYITENLNDNTPTWSYNEGAIGTTPVFMLTQQTNAKVGMVVGEDVYPAANNYGMIYAATYGRGIFNNNSFQAPVGINDNEITVATEQNVQIYPNPVTNNATVSFNLENNSKVELKVYDLNGRVVLSINENRFQKGDNQIALDVSDLSRGTYILQFITSTSISSSKFIVSK